MERRACCLGRQSTCFSVPLTLPSGLGPSHQGTGLSAPAGVPSLNLASALCSSARAWVFSFSISRAFSSASRRFSASS